MIEAVYFTDSTNTLVFEYTPTLQSPHFHSLSNIIHANISEELPFIKVNTEYFLCYQKLTNLTIYTLFCNSNTSNPIEALVFIERLVSMMTQYFGTPLTASKLEFNTDALLFMLKEMIGDGVYNVTDFNQMKDILFQKSFFTKLLDAVRTDLASNSGGTSSPKSNKNYACESETPWRQTNIKYNINEVFVDLTEIINVIMKPKASNRAGIYEFHSTNLSSGNLTPISGTINGEIQLTSRLSGNPRLKLSLQPSGSKIIAPSMHRCVSFNANTLSFIPPDGKSTLFQYSIDVTPQNIGLVNLDLITGLGAKRNEFELRLFIKSHPSTKKIENLVVKVVAPSRIVDIKHTRMTHGDWVSNGTNMGEWKIKSLSTGVQPIFKGILLTTNNESDVDEEEQGNEEANEVNTKSKAATIELSQHFNNPIIPEYCSLTYDCKGSLPSGIKVDSLMIMQQNGIGETGVNPYKGVKYITKTGDFIVRSK